MACVACVLEECGSVDESGALGEGGETGARAGETALETLLAVLLRDLENIFGVLRKAGEDT